MTPVTAASPWHRHLWPWIIIAILTGSVALTLAMVTIAVTHPDNEASQRVARRLGMRDEGLTDRYYDTTTRLFVLER